MILIGAVLFVMLVVGLFGGGGKMPSFPTVSMSNVTPVGSKTSLKELGLVDTIQRHNVISAVDTWTSLTYAKGVLVGAAVKVPIDAGFLSKIDVVTSGDYSNTATNGLYCTSAFRLSGNGLKRAGLHRYMANAHSTGGKTAGGFAARSKVISYSTKIEVKPGNEINIEGIMCGSDIGDLSMSVTLTFTKMGREHGIEDSDIREADITAKDTDTTITTLGADTLGNLTVPSEFNNIAAVYSVLAVGVGADITSQYRAMVVFSLAGNAMKESGFYQWNAEALQIGDITTGLAAVVSEPEIDPIDVRAKSSDIIELHAVMIEEDPGLVNVMVGVLYSSDGVI